MFNNNIFFFYYLGNSYTSAPDLTQTYLDQSYYFMRFIK